MKLGVIGTEPRLPPPGFVSHPEPRLPPSAPSRTAGNLG